VKIIQFATLSVLTTQQENGPQNRTQARERCLSTNCFRNVSQFATSYRGAIGFCFTVLMFSSIAWAAEVLVCFKEGLEKL
jgi:hypothetical protein